LAQQIVGDNTLGAESSLVTPRIPRVFQIDGGATRGTNLFHSFSQFSVPTNGTARFNNALNIQNIVTRVTGESVSNIDGLIKANGTANLFLLNPNGIIFGPNASLNIGGSFIGSTASSILFTDGTQFSTTPTQTTPVLTISVPLGLQYGANAGSIQVQGSTLKVPNGKTIALVGGNVQLNGAFLQVPGGRVELGGVAGTGTVGLSVEGNDLGLSFPLDLALSDISLTNGAEVNVLAGGGGSIALNAHNLNMKGESKLRAGIDSGLGSIGSSAGNIDINAIGAINLTEESFISNGVLKGGVGNGGSINITTGSLSVSNDAFLIVSTYGRGDAGSVNINARDTVSFDRGDASSEVNEGALGNGGSINITTRSLFVSNGAQLSTDTYGTGDAGSVNINARDTVSFNGGDVYSSVEEKGALGKGGSINITTGSLFVSYGYLIVDTYGTGDAGSVNINARDTVSFDDGALVFSDVNNGAIGKGGSINITTGSLFVSNGTQLSADTYGRGDAGSVNINARDTVSFDRAYAFSEVNERALGNGGSINITTGSLFVSNGAFLTTSTYGTRNAGSVNINARDTVSFDDRTRASSEVNEGALGNGGSINITTGSLFVSNRAFLTTSTYGRGNAGSVNINARDAVSFDRGDVSSEVKKGALGNGGSINITTGSLFVYNRGSLSASSNGNGRAGNIEVAAHSIRLDNQGVIIATTSSGNGGDITLRVKDLLLMRHGSEISTTAGTAQAGGDGGNITIDTDFIVAVPKENSNITANAFTGRGGNINITTQGIYGLQFRPRLTSLSDITASSNFGVNGIVQINTPDVDPSRGLAELPVEPVHKAEVAQGCQTGGKQASIEFFNTGKGGLAPNPYEPLSSSELWEDVPSPIRRTAASASTDNASTSPATQPDKIVEAQGWLINEKGKVILVAERHTTHSHGRCRLR
jgi:filamentous hemagglutinin family protein